MTHPTGRPPHRCDQQLALRQEVAHRVRWFLLGQGPGGLWTNGQGRGRLVSLRLSGQQEWDAGLSALGTWERPVGKEISGCGGAAGTQ